MSYNTTGSFRSFSFTSGSFDNVSDFVVAEALEIAANRIDAALRPHHTLPLASGSVPSVILEAERVLAGYWLWLNVGIDPGVGSQFLKDRYKEIAGVPENPASGFLGMLAYGKISLVTDNDQDPSPPKAIVQVYGNCSRGWQQWGGKTVF